MSRELESHRSYFDNRSTTSTLSSPQYRGLIYVYKMAKSKAFPFKSHTIWHACGHNERHALPCGLQDAARDRVTAALANERCWRCVVDEAWDWLLSKPSGDL